MHVVRLLLSVLFGRRKSLTKAARIATLGLQLERSELRFPTDDLATSMATYHEEIDPTDASQAWRMLGQAGAPDHPLLTWVFSVALVVAILCVAVVCVQVFCG